ncbi:MAG: hypothetical protein ACRBCT_08295 [Alphaproteobacteria bacterium]
MNYYEPKINREVIMAGGFAVCLVAFMVTMIFISMNSMSPMILGTELNPNGTVEYLCLGRGCEGLTPMDY